MTAAELRDLRKRSGLTLRRTAELSCVTLRTVQKWEAEDQAIPLPASALLAWSCCALGGPVGLLARWMHADAVRAVKGEK